MYRKSLAVTSISHLKGYACHGTVIILKIPWMLIREVPLELPSATQIAKILIIGALFEQVLNFLGGERHLWKSDYSYEPSSVAAPEFLGRTVLGAETYWRPVSGGPALKLAGQSDERLK